MRLNFASKRILIAPLDWGLGHATRCIPIAEWLRRQGCEIFFACDGYQKTLLQQEFPDNTFLLLKGYKIQYSGNKRMLPLKILLQAPKILFAIKHEHEWLQKTIKDHNIDLVISDNRYGLWTDKIPCIFLTHQLHIRASLNWLEKLIQKINYRYINHYIECWVPDFRGDFNIAGNLSHPAILPKVKVKYIGVLSRFKNISEALKKYDWLVILSGPEPQRTILENKIINTALQLTEKFLLVRGKPGSSEMISTPANCVTVNHLDTNDMEQAFADSKYVLSRSGYTTVMELLSLQKKTLLIPTPGQTEQEYLANHLMQQKWCYCCEQDDDLKVHIKKAVLFDYRFPRMPASSLEDAIADFFTHYLS